MAVLVGLVFLAACAVDGPPVEEQEGAVEPPAQPVQLSSGDSSASFELENVSERSLEWRIEVDHDSGNPQSGDWFRINPEEGRLDPLERQLVTLTQHSDAAAGEYVSTLRVIYDGGETLFEVSGLVAENGGGADGDGVIRGRLETPNSEIPISPPDSSFARTSSALERGEAEQAADQDAEQDAAEYLPNQLVVGLKPTLSTLSVTERRSRVEELARQLNATILESGEDRAILTLPEGTDPREAAQLLDDDSAVRFAEPNYIFRLHAVPNDPRIDQAWHLPAIGAPLAWEAAADARTLPTVAVIDSGFDLDHEDLRGVFVNDGYDFCGSSGCPNSSRDSDPRPDDPFFNTHGTHVTGLLAAIGNNNRGSSGVIRNGARIVPIKTFTNGSTTETAVADAIRWAAGGNVPNAPSNPDPADIITISLGAVSDSTLVREAVQFAQSRGALLIASVGNAGHGDVDYPARYPDVLGVGAVNSQFNRSCFSDYGNGLDIMAPGGDGYLCDAPRDEALLSTFPQDDYGLDAGTSMAAPIVAAAAALTWATMEVPDAQSVARRLQESAWYDADYMSENRYGAGVLRLDRSLGYPGPGDEATVQASGESNRLDTVMLDATGSSSEFVLDDLAAGNYSLEAESAGRSRTLEANDSLDLGSGDEASITIQMRP